MTFKSLTIKGIGDLQRSMERFETYNDPFILPDHYLVVRLDAHRLGDWGIPQSEYPCGPKATAAFHETVIGLMTTSYRVILAYQHGDEISLLVDPSENNNPLRRSKLISAFCSVAAVSLLQTSGLPALFDAKVSELPSIDRVLEYFLWQRRYCFRNALTIALRKALLSQGLSPEQAERQIHGVSEEARLQKLHSLNAPMSQVPHTTRRGSLFVWDSSNRGNKEQFCIRTDRSLPEDDEAFLALIANTLQPSAIPKSIEKSHNAKQAIASQDNRPTTTNKTNSRPQEKSPTRNPQAMTKGRSKTNTSIFKSLAT